MTIDDGQGGSITQTVSVTIGGTNDEIVRGANTNTVFTEVDGETIGTIRFYFTDVDLADVHTGTAFERVGSSGGTVIGSPIGRDADGRFFIDVEHRHSNAVLDAGPADLLDWRYQVRISDNAGDDLLISRIVTFDGVDYYVGDGANDDLRVIEGSRSVLIGGGDSDRLTGGARDDALFGDAGPAIPSNLENMHDGLVYAGNAFDDLLNGGGGSDYLTGGDGADVFEFDFGEADGDVVTDFGEGDRLVFKGWGPDAKFTKVGDNTWALATADGSVAETITFTNPAEILISENAFFI